MPFRWTTDETPVLNPAADFRVNVADRALADALQIEAGEIWWMTNVDLPDGVSLEKLIANLGELGLEGDALDFLAIPPEYTDEERRLTEGERTATVFARSAYINAANKNAKKAGLAWLEVGRAFRPDDLILQENPFLPPSEEDIIVQDGSVVMAVIDNGMAVGHPLFQQTDANGYPESRIHFFLNMDDAKSDPDLLLDGQTELASIGRVWTRKGLTQQLRDNIHDGLLDDEAFYTAIGVLDWAGRRHSPVAHRVSHGTHVMGLCAGYPTEDASEVIANGTRPIIAVNLRTLDIVDPMGVDFDKMLHDVLRFIMNRYKRFKIEDAPNKRPPLVINFSFGNQSGPHDGSSKVERRITDFLAPNGQRDPLRQFVLPAGNSNDIQCHARLCLTPQQPSQTLTWRIQPGDRTASEMQIWLDAEGDVLANYANLTISGPGIENDVTVDCAPSGAIHKIKLSTCPAENACDCPSIGYAYFCAAQNSPFKRGHFAVRLYTTSSPADVGPFVPSGAWHLTLASTQLASQREFKAWIKRDDRLPGFPNYGRQSYFDDPHYAKFYAPDIEANPLDPHLIGAPLGYDPLHSDALVRRSGTLSGFTAADGVIVIGGYRNAVDLTQSPMALYSATGPTNEPCRCGPDASALSDASRVLFGVQSAGSASGSMVSMPGTSVSAPQVARWCANELAAKRPANATAVQHKADQSDPTNPAKPPKERSGAGRMFDLPNLFGRKRWPGQSY